MRINELMPPAELPSAIAAPNERRRTPILDDEGHLAEVAGPRDITRHFVGAHADSIARTLAAVSHFEPKVSKPER